ncbi:MAG: hypothetical protein OK455_00680 [Thaumarchaeota archaeon]|nr:hypothetical protein [Nitrososphaerota archaeon]
MKIFSILEVVVVNAVLLALLAWVTGDYSTRADYWGPESFTPTMVRYPLFMITSAARGSTVIPGLLTVDWQQIIVLILVVTDVIYLWSATQHDREQNAQQALQKAK